MAEIFPFRALRYDLSRVSAASVLTQPYDKITPEMQDRYYSASPYNLVRIILGKPEARDDARCNVYTRAAECLRQWRKGGVLRQDPRPCIYAYTQEFASPGAGIRHTRRGFIALGRIHDYSDRVVFRHEQTLAKPKADRLQLLRATRAHFGQIFMLYSDPGQKVDSLLAAAGNSAPAVEATDEYGVVHRLWALDDEGSIAAVQGSMRDKQLIIADGHHRYETALAFRDECRGAGASHGGWGDAASAPCERVMMTFINMESPGLIVLPTHRVLRGLPEERIRTLAEQLNQFFKVEQLELTQMTGALQELENQGKAGTALLMVTQDKAYILKALPEAISAALGQVSNDQRELDVVVLHKSILERLLGLSEESIRNQQNISYFRNANDAVEMVRGASRSAAAQLAFLMNPVRMEQMRRVALGGEFMPQKSTDFFPKLLSGLTIYALE